MSYRNWARRTYPTALCTPCNSAVFHGPQAKLKVCRERQLTGGYYCTAVPCTSPRQAFALKAGCQFYGRCRRKYWTIAPIPNTIAGNRIATTIGGRADAFGVMSRGATMTKAAARPVIATHCLAILEKL